VAVAEVGVGIFYRLCAVAQTNIRRQNPRS